MTVDIEPIMDADIVTISGTTPRVDAKWNEKNRSFNVRFMNEDVVNHAVQNVKSFTVKCGDILSRAVKDGMVVYTDNRKPGSITCRVASQTDSNYDVTCGVKQ